MLVVLGLFAGCQSVDSVGVTATDDSGSEQDLADERDLAHSADAGIADSAVSDSGSDAAPSDAAPSDAGTVWQSDLGPSTCGTGTQQWVTRAATKLNTNSGDLILGDVSVRPDGNIWVIGSLSSTATFGEGTIYQQTLSGGNGILVARYASDGTFRWGRVYQSAYNSFATGTHIRALADGGAILALSFEDTVKLDSSLPSEVIFSASDKNDYDIVLARLGADGHAVWARQAGGSGDDFPQALDVTPDGKSAFVAVSAAMSP